MPVQHNEIRGIIRSYLYDYPEESAALQPIRDLLEVGADVTSRAEERGHITASAILVNPTGHMLWIHHVKHRQWIWPGGHLEPVDDSLRHGALRELVEETGIDAAKVASIGVGPLQIDAHTIPANERTGEPEHRHVDFRFLFATVADVGELQHEEVSASKWLPGDLLPEPLRGRVSAAAAMAIAEL